MADAYLITITLILVFGNITSTVKILSPFSASNAIKQLYPSGGTSITHIYIYIEIPHKIGNFGQVPYGKTLTGQIFLQKNSDGSNYWCDYSKTSTPEELTHHLVYSYTSIFLVDQYVLFNHLFLFTSL